MCLSNCASLSVLNHDRSSWPLFSTFRSTLCNTNFSSHIFILKASVVVSSYLLERAFSFSRSNRVSVVRAFSHCTYPILPASINAKALAVRFPPPLSFHYLAVHFFYSSFLHLECSQDPESLVRCAELWLIVLSRRYKHFEGCGTTISNTLKLHTGL